MTYSGDGVQYSRVGSAVSNRDAGTDFTGNLTEFQILFEWIWETDETRLLHEKATNLPFNGIIHIQDSKLDESTYPGQHQKIKFEEGKIKFQDSLD